MPAHSGGNVDSFGPLDPRPESFDQLLRAPNAIRLDNGPEIISQALTEWAVPKGIAVRYIQPGKPNQNAFIERYNRSVRYDWPAQYLFETVADVQDYASRWLRSYNHERPNMALGRSHGNNDRPSWPSFYSCER